MNLISEGTHDLLYLEGFVHPGKVMPQLPTLNFNIATCNADGLAKSSVQSVLKSINIQNILQPELQSPLKHFPNLLPNLLFSVISSHAEVSFISHSIQTLSCFRTDVKFHLLLKAFLYLSTWK